MDLGALNNYEHVFSEADDYGRLPDQEFDVVVDEITIGMTSGGHPRFSWKLRVLGGLYDGRIIYKNNTISSEDSAKVFKNDLGLCKFHSNSLKDVFTGDHDPLLGCRLRVKHVTRENGYTSVYFRELLSTGEECVNVNRDGEVDGHPEA